LWSRHHYFREKLFDKIPLNYSYSLSNSNKYNTEIIKENESDDDSDNDNDNINNENKGESKKLNYTKTIKKIPKIVKPNFRINRQAEFGKQVFSLHFTDLTLDFFRKHYGGGNGIELVIQNFVIVGSESRFPAKEGKLLFLFYYQFIN
jgi:hypothetical protein